MERGLFDAISTFNDDDIYVFSIFVFAYFIISSHRIFIFAPLRFFV